VSAAKHTPGPWIVGRDGYINGKDEFIPAGTWRVTYAGGPAYIRGIREADARLIATAPELLEVAQLLASFSFTSELSLGEITEKARAAILKATGSAS
jgi:hypothetical protein